MANSPTFGNGRLLHPAKCWTALYKYKYMCLHTQAYSLNVIYHFSTMIFQPYQSLGFPSSIPGETDICAHRLFCTKFNFKQLLFEDFFDGMCIYGSVES